MSLEKNLIDRNSNQHLIDNEKQENNQVSDSQRNSCQPAQQNISYLLLNDKQNQQNSINQSSFNMSGRYSQQIYWYKNRKISFSLFLIFCLIVLAVLGTMNYVPTINDQIHNEYIGFSIALIISFCCFIRFYYYQEKTKQSMVIFFLFSFLSQGYLYVFSHCFFQSNYKLINLPIMFLSYISGDVFLIIIYTFLNIQKDFFIQIGLAVIHLISMVFLMIFLKEYFSIAITCIFSYFYIIIAYVVSQESDTSIITQLYQATKLWVSLNMYVLTLIMITFVLFIFI